MVGFGNAGSSSSAVDKDSVSVNSRTGFRSLNTIPDLLGIDDYDYDYVPRPDAIEPTPYDYSVDPFLETDSNENPDGGYAGVSDENIQANKDYINKYNNALDASNNFGDGGYTQFNIDNPVANPTDYYGNPIRKEMHAPSFDPRMFIPGGSLLSLSDQAIPTSGYGTPGTYSSLTGGRFNEHGQSVNPITGQPIAEYSTTGAFKNQMMTDPLNNTTTGQGGLTDLEYAGSTSELASIKDGTTDPMGNPANTGLSKANEKTVQTALGGGAAPLGSQTSKSGVFSTVSPQQQQDDNNQQAANAAAAAEMEAKSGITVEDFGGSDDGGGGGGGCVVATHGVSTGAFTLMEKAKAELWCQKTYHGKWYGEAFRKGYRAAGMKQINNNTAPNVYQEFKDFVAYGRGIKKGWKLGINYYYRTITFFITGLFIGDN